MKKSILNLGKALQSEEQKKVFGGVDKITKFDPKCEKVVSEGKCWSYEYPYGYEPFQVEIVGNGVNGNDIVYHYSCDC